MNRRRFCLIVLSIIVVTITILGYLNWKARDRTGSVVTGDIAYGTSIEILHPGVYRAELHSYSSDITTIVIVDGKRVEVDPQSLLENPRKITNITDKGVFYEVVTLDNSSDLKVETTLSSYEKKRTVVFMLMAVAFFLFVKSLFKLLSEIDD